MDFVDIPKGKKGLSDSSTDLSPCVGFVLKMTPRFPRVADCKMWSFPTHTGEKVNGWVMSGSSK